MTRLNLTCKKSYFQIRYITDSKRENVKYEFEGVNTNEHSRVPSKRNIAKI